MILLARLGFVGMYEFLIMRFYSIFGSKKMLFLMFFVQLLSFNSSLLFCDDSFPKISSITIEGTKTVSKEAVLRVIDYFQSGFYDRSLSSENIKKIDKLGRFETIELLEKISPDGSSVDLKFRVLEKKLLKKIEIEGNSAISSKKLLDKSGLKSIESVSDHDVKVAISKMISEYKDINYLDPDVRYELSELDENSADLNIYVAEGSKTLLSRVNFYGLNQVPESIVRPRIATREAWLLSAMDGSGKLSQEMVDRDQKIIEDIYQDRGFLGAKVVNARVRKNAQTNVAEVDFYIHEGERSKIRFITLPGNDDEFSAKEFSSRLSIKRGDFYSKSKLISSLERIRNLLGDLGYIDCDVRPDVLPVEGEKNMVDINFYIEKGDKFIINKIDITGNKATKDSVIRRELNLCEGELATKRKMDISKYDVEALGYFENDQVDWVVKRIGGGRVDLELNVKEARTGNGNLGLTYGSDHSSSTMSAKIIADLKKRNFAGMGWDLGGSVQIGRNKIQSGEIDFVNPHLFDKNIFLSLNSYLKRSEYDEMGSVFAVPPVEETKGFVSSLGFSLFPTDTKIQTLFEFGVESIGYLSEPRFLSNHAGQSLKDFFMEDKIRKGAYNWLGLNFVKDMRNHPIYPSMGWKAELKNKMIAPAFNDKFNMLKTEMSVRHYLPLIGRDRLVFASHAKLGFISNFASGKPVPNKEIYHVGGIENVRGFRWGEAGPMYKEGLGAVPLGAKNLMVANFELITPMTFSSHVDAYTPRAYVFCDIGGGWNAPESSTSSITFDKTKLVNNEFHMRKTVGFGVKLSSPYPIRFDWGYKLDRNSFTKERPSELHITMNIPL